MTTHVNDHDKWEEGVFRQAFGFKLVLHKGFHEAPAALIPDYVRAMKAAFILQAEGKRVLLYAVSLYTTVLLPPDKWRHYLEIWRASHNVGLSE